MHVGIVVALHFTNVLLALLPCSYGENQHSGTVQCYHHAVGSTWYHNTMVGIEHQRYPSLVIFDDLS